MSDKSFDEELLKNMLLKCMDEIFSKMNSVSPSEPSKVAPIDIVEYEGRMRVSGIDKFNSASFGSVVNFYLNQGDLARHKPKGVIVVFIDSENASKFYKSLSFKVPDDEDEVSMMDACGEVCKLVSSSLNQEISNAGYAHMVTSEPFNFKNTVLHGVEFSTDQVIKQEFSFFYWKRKTIVVELSLAHIPKQ